MNKNVRELLAILKHSESKRRGKLLQEKMPFAKRYLRALGRHRKRTCGGGEGKAAGWIIDDVGGWGLGPISWIVRPTKKALYLAPQSAPFAVSVLIHGLASAVGHVP